MSMSMFGEQELHTQDTLFRYTLTTAVMIYDTTWRYTHAYMVHKYTRVCVYICALLYFFTYEPVFQIDAHVGGVNDLAFSHPNKQLCVITCGDDKTIKVSLSEYELGLLKWRS